ncbi:Lipase (class 3) [Musa troglodytarum]|nr:Lipase (class 3) [Musa troglodytarum]
MGSSLAVLFGYDLAELGLSQATPITVYSFGGPRIGNLGFKERCEELGVKVLRVVNVNDPITKMPGVLLNEHLRAVAEKYELPCYAHVGVEVALDFFEMNNPVHVHDMEAYVRALKRPKEATNQGNSGTNLVSKARRFWRGQNFDAWQWQEAATHLGNLVKSLRAGRQIEPRVHRR